MTTIQKIQKAAEDFDLTRSEIKKIYSAAKRRNKGKLPELTGWYCAGGNSFRPVECEICDGLTGERLDDVVIEVCMFDRRMSFVRKVASEIQ